MVNHPRLLLIGSDAYLSELADLLGRSGADIETAAPEPGENGQNGMAAASQRVERAWTRMGGVDALIFCDRFRPLESAKPDPEIIIGETLHAVKGLMAAVRGMALKMIETGIAGQIIVVCDISAVAGRHHAIVSSTAGGALLGMSKSLAKEMGRYRIAVNMICLGPVAGIGAQSALSDAEAVMLKATGLGKQGSLAHLANNIMHLARGEHWLNGQILHLNDGLVM